MNEDRPAPPPLEMQPPNCPICDEETTFDADGFMCGHCDAWWKDLGAIGEWINSDAPQCEATVQPLADNRMASDKARARVSRCALDAGHDGLHASVDFTYAVKGWKW